MADTHPQQLRQDLGAGIVVFLVAVPLCLGIAMASGAPLAAGVIAGVIGGVIVGLLSGSQLSVSGPAAGLTVVVIAGLEALGSWPLFLAATVLAGALQLALAGLRAGVVGHFFPSSVVRGLLAAIGLILILKQIPHALGYDVDFEGDFAFWQPGGENTFTALAHALGAANPGALLIAGVSLLFLFLWDRPGGDGPRFTRALPGPLWVVGLGVLLNSLVLPLAAPDWVLGPEHLVGLPVVESAGELLGLMTLPDFEGFLQPAVWTIAVTIALVASLESLLTLEAADRLDPRKRIAPPNRELFAQGTGNVLSGLVGGLPMTAVVVRTTANISAGAQTRLATIVHGVLLLLAMAFGAVLLNRIPLAALAAVLILVGYRLTRPSLYVEQWRRGPAQFAPFATTLVAILLTDLLVGVLVGLAVGLAFVVFANFRRAFTLTQDGGYFILRLSKDVSFLNKAALRETLASIPDGAYVIVDGTPATFIDPDILETLEDFRETAHYRGIEVETKRSTLSNNPEFAEDVAA